MVLYWWNTTHIHTHYGLVTDVLCANWAGCVVLWGALYALYFYIYYIGRIMKAP